MRPPDFDVSWTEAYFRPGGTIFAQRNFRTALEPTSYGQEPFDRMLRRQALASRVPFAPVRAAFTAARHPGGDRRRPNPSARLATARSISSEPAGRPDLLTVKALRLITGAEVVVYDHLVGEAVVALIPPGARRLYAGKEAGTTPWPSMRSTACWSRLASEGHDDGPAQAAIPSSSAAAAKCALFSTRASGVRDRSRHHRGGGGGLGHQHSRSREQCRPLVFATGHLKGRHGRNRLAGARPPAPDGGDLHGPGRARDHLYADDCPRPGGTTPAAVIHAATRAASAACMRLLASLPGGAPRASAPALIMIGDGGLLDPGARACSLSGSS